MTHMLLMTTLTLTAPPQYPGPVHTVKAFAMNAGKGRPACLMPLEDDGTPCKSVTKTVTLDDEQARLLLATLRDKKSYGEPEPRCFIPHHGFAFYDDVGTLLGQVGLCFMCQNLRSDPPIPAQPGSPRKSALTKATIKTFRTLCKTLKLGMCNKR